MAKFWLIEIEDEKVNTGPAAVLLVGILLAVQFLPKVATWLCEWRQHSYPIKYVSAFYYYTLAKPISWILSPFDFILSQSLTPYPILNFVLCIALVVLFLIIFLCLLLVLSQIFSKYWKIMVRLYAFGPWVLFGVWFGIKLLFWQPEQTDASNEANCETIQVVADINHTNISNAAEMEELKTDGELFPTSNEVTVDTSSNTTGVQDPNIEHAERSTNSTEKVEKKGFFRKLKNIVF